MVHYNVQSFANKIDITEPELTDFDIISLTGTWLNDSISNEDLKFNEFQAPFRRDRIGDSHGGIMVYVKKDIPCKRRIDLELVNIECLWIEVYAKTKKVLIGTFYRPPNSTPVVFSDIENSIGLATDTGIEEIVVTGDLNLNMLNPHSRAKILDVCQTYNLTQLINEPTHYTETSSSIIDLILVSNLRSVELSRVSEPFCYTMSNIIAQYLLFLPLINKFRSLLFVKYGCITKVILIGYGNVSPNLTGKLLKAMMSTFMLPLLLINSLIYLKTVFHTNILELGLEICLGSIGQYVNL